MWISLMLGAVHADEPEQWESDDCSTYKKWGSVTAWGSAGVLAAAGAVSYAGGVLDNRELVWVPQLAYPVGLAGSVIGGGFLIASSKECGMHRSAVVAGIGSVLLGGGVVATSWGAVIMEATKSRDEWNEVGYQFGTGLLGLGVASLGTGVVMMALHKPKTRQVSALPRIGRDTGITVVGRF